MTVRKRHNIKKRKLKGKKCRYLLITIAALLTLLLIVGLIHVSKHLQRHNLTVSRLEYPIQGIDVSNHNGNIDFAKVAADSIAFVYIKATEGESHKDKRFARNIHEARKAGLKAGAYHFFRKDVDGKAQASHFIATIRGVKTDLPPVVDVEDWGNSHFTTDSKTIENLIAMITHLEKNGLSPMIYTNKSCYRKYMQKHLPKTRLWLCAFDHPRELSDYNWTIHQYSHWGNVDGIEGDVDLNVFNGDSVLWNSWLGSQP